MKSIKVKILLLLVCILGVSSIAYSQHSVARQWNEVLLDGIRNDFARPTVHARNLFHASIAMYDAWAAFDDRADTYLLGRTVGNYTCDFDGIEMHGDIREAREEAISYAVYRLISHRFTDSPGADSTLSRCARLFHNLEYDPLVVSVDYSTGSPAALGNYIAQSLIELGMQDGSNEQDDYANLFYEPVNPTLIPVIPGNPDIVDPNRWQPLTLSIYIDQSGHVIPVNTPSFLSPEWGTVTPFALSPDDLTVYERNGNEYWVYHDPGDPPFLSLDESGIFAEDYKWGFSLVALWSSHLDPADSVMIDISPASFGNLEVEDYPQTFEGMQDFYLDLEGGDISTGHTLNPHTGLPYEPQIVPRADYTRVLAEFWADGPDSETPPGHWFTILNYVSDHPDFEKRFKGEGPVLEDLEWDIKAYFTLAGAVHDAAVTAWGIKGWYDYLRPISAIRLMSDLGQSSDPGLPHYHPAGITLQEGFIELVSVDDPLAGPDSSNVNKIKIYSWRGPDFIDDPDTSVAGVGWILAENWWPYQRPSFVTPPFAGYVSGHSVFSRSAAEIMTMLTGDPFFPGGMGEFLAPKNEFLVFEDGPSVDIILQWATYRDASDQTSLSRIWGGIHPPADDIPGRLMGIEIGVNAFNLAECFFLGAADEPECQVVTSVSEATAPGKNVRFFPNPASDMITIDLSAFRQNEVCINVLNSVGMIVKQVNIDEVNFNQISIDLSGLKNGLHIVTITDKQEIHSTGKVVIQGN
jgi:hypothetical protein